MDTEEGHHAMKHLPADKADIHLEADIHAVEDNPNGFAEGDWIPYLTVEYTVTKLDAPEKKQHLLLTVRAVDENKNPCFRESGKVHFAVEGAAKIVGVDNGDICSNEPYQEDSVHLYHGCASVMLELEGKPGRVCVRAFGNGLRQAQTVVTVCGE